MGFSQEDGEILPLKYQNLTDYSLQNNKFRIIFFTKNQHLTQLMSLDQLFYSFPIQIKMKMKIYIEMKSQHIKNEYSANQ